MNLSLAVVLMDTSIGNTKFSLILTALDIPPPIKTAMQRHSNEVTEKIKDLNKNDMLEKLWMVEACNKEIKTGNPKERFNSVSMDVMAAEASRQH